MRILFCLHDLGFADHISIAHLSAIAKQSGHTTYFTMLDSLIPKVNTIKPDVVAYSTNIIGFTSVVAANTKARGERHFISIMGGAQPTFSPETFPQSGMDAYCVGEGDYAFRDFLANINDFSKVDNLTTRVSANKIRPIITNLDELPLADRDLVLSNSFIGKSSKKTFYATRGCPFGCNYCSNNYYHKLYSGQKAVRRFSVERMIKEIEYVGSHYRMDFVKFGDDCFTLKADDWLEEFTDKYASRVGKLFNCYLRVDMIDEKMLRLLKKANCHSVTLSVDSVSPYIRETILNRKMKKEDIVEKLRMVRSYGIYTVVNYMLAAPESTLQNELDTIEQARRGNITWMNYTTTVPMAKTALYDYCVERELISPLTYEGDMSGCNKRSELSCFTDKDKDIRLNIFLMGDWISKLPTPALRSMAIWLIKIIPPNKWFVKFNSYRYLWYMEHKIFKVNDKLRSPRFWQRKNVS